jgi:hypothetical protein
MANTMTIGQFFPGNSFLYKLDPRTKLILTMLLIILVFITKSFVDQYIDKIFVTPEKDGTIRLDIRIFTGEATEKYLQKLKVRAGQMNHLSDRPEENATAATVLGDGVRPGHTSKKMIEAYEQGLQ